MLGILGLLLALVCLIVMALRGINIVFSALLCTLIVINSNAMPLADSLYNGFIFGDLGAFTFAGKFFFLFAAGAIFGRVMADSHAATSIAMALVRLLGARHALLITVLASALLTYGGVVVFVVIFAIYPLGLRLLQQANIPKRLFCAALALGAGTFTLTALPGTPSIQNIIPTAKLGTDIFAAPLLGTFGGAIMFILGYFYLEYARKQALSAGENFEPGKMDNIPDLDEIADKLPHWGLAILPLFTVILLILLPRLLTMGGSDMAGYAMIAFANSQPILWPSIALICGSLLAIILAPNIWRSALTLLGNGTQEAIMPLIATSAVIGFGGVVSQTGGFASFAQSVTQADLPPLVSLFAAISVISAITGSASGGLQIFMATLSDHYAAMGIDPEIMHRILAMASGGLDSLPHCGAVVAMLAITGLTHKQAYKDIAVVTVVIPVIATISSIILVSFF